MTKDPFIVYSSNVFAILSLRALYSFVASIMSELRFLNKAVALVLGFVGEAFTTLALSVPKLIAKEAEDVTMARLRSALAAGARARFRNNRMLFAAIKHTES